MQQKHHPNAEDTKYAIQNSKYANQNSKFAQFQNTLFCRDAIFVANFRSFLAYNLQAKIYSGVQKMKNDNEVCAYMHFYR